MNEDLAALAPLTRLAFQGLWLLADREGRLEDRPTRIKAQLFPYHEADLAAILDSLSPAFITRYKSGELSCIQIVNFKKHQHIHPDEKVSILPAPTEIPGDPRRSPAIMPCSSSPSSSSSPSPKQPQTDSPTATDRRKELSTLVDSLGKSKIVKRSDEQTLELSLQFQYGDLPKGIAIRDIPPSCAQSLLDNAKRLRLAVDFIRGLKYRIKIKHDELHPQLRRA